MEILLATSERLTEYTKDSFKRGLYHQINWNNRLIGIKGARGTGKTTLLLQRIKSLGRSASEVAYFTLDDLYFTTNSLVETAAEFRKKGGKILFLDEVHKYLNWATHLKNLYDLYPDLQIVFTGSSIVDISRQEVDLSRRVLMYELPGMSYREYLAFEEILTIEALPLHLLMSENQDWKSFFPRGFKPLQYFESYLSSGYYPFFREDKQGYVRRIQQLIRMIVEYDMAELQDFDIRNAKKMLQLLYILAENVPFKPNLSDLADKSGIHRNSVTNYLHFLEQAKLIQLLYKGGNSVTVLQKPEKIYLENTNLAYALSIQKPDIGNLRETFFMNQVSYRHSIQESPISDFLVNGMYTFEVGGKNKSKKQIEGLTNAYLVKDDIETGFGNTIPLWLFGFLY
jgi:predicted AAA+ superfamily ATPase